VRPAEQAEMWADAMVCMYLDNLGLVVASGVEVVEGRDGLEGTGLYGYKAAEVVTVVAAAVAVAIAQVEVVVLDSILLLVERCPASRAVWAVANDHPCEVLSFDADVPLVVCPMYHVGDSCCNVDAFQYRRNGGVNCGVVLAEHVVILVPPPNVGAHAYSC